ncbi:swi5-dependent recombination DNA repair protein 1 homolog [Petromyzon marinus]
MSSMLRQRLIKSRRSFELTHPKRRCFASSTEEPASETVLSLEQPSQGLEEDVRVLSPDRGATERNTELGLSTPEGCAPTTSPGESDLKRTPASSLNISTGSSTGVMWTPGSGKALSESQATTIQQMAKELEDMKRALGTKEELLRRLRLVSSYRSKNNLEELQRLILKWRSACQSLLCDLQQEATSDKVYSLGQIIAGMGLDPDLLQYNSTEDCFT